MNNLEKTLKIVSGYEGISGLKPDGKYYPEHMNCDGPGLLTIGRGHLLSPADLVSGRFDHGLSLEEVEDLFLRDLAPRALSLKKWCPNATDDQFASALAMYFNNEKSWISGTPGVQHRLKNYKAAAAGMLLYIKNSELQNELGLWRRRMTEALCYLNGEVIVAKDEDTEQKLFSALRVIIPVVRPKLVD